MKILVVLLMFGCTFLGILGIVNTIRLKKIKKKTQKRFYQTPKLSELHGKAFAEYMDYLTRDL